MSDEKPIYHTEQIVDDEIIKNLYELALNDLTLSARSGEKFAKFNYEEFLIFCSMGKDKPEWHEKFSRKSFLISKNTYKKYMEMCQSENAIIATFADDLLNLGMRVFKKQKLKEAHNETHL